MKMADFSAVEKITEAAGVASRRDGYYCDYFPGMQPVELQTVVISGDYLKTGDAIKIAARRGLRVAWDHFNLGSGCRTVVMMTAADNDRREIVEKWQNKSLRECMEIMHRELNNSGLNDILTGVMTAYGTECARELEEYNAARRV